MNNSYKKYLRAALSVFVFLAAWEITARLGIINVFFVSSPIIVAKEGCDMVVTGFLWPHLFVSMTSLIVGFSLAVILGIIAGLFIGFKENVYDYIHPFIFTLSSTPLVAAVPLIIIWFGIGISSKIFVIFLMAIVPILINTIGGVKNTNKNLLDMGQSFEASGLFLIERVVFFSALPSIFSGIRIATGRAIVGLVIAEVFGYGKGLGYLVSFYGGVYQSGRLIFILIVLALIGMLLISAVDYMEKKVIP